MTDFINETIKYTRSGQSAFYVNSREESRVVAEIRRAGWLRADIIDLEKPLENGKQAALELQATGVDINNWRAAVGAPIDEIHALFDETERYVSGGDKVQNKRINTRAEILIELLDRSGFLT